jgi:hypothetical protein
MEILHRGLYGRFFRAQIWQPMFSWLRDRTQDYELKQGPLVLVASGR